MKKKIYVLVGIAASGKSTYSMKLMDEHSGLLTKIINADTIRKRLYGDATIQGNPDEVFKEVYKEYTDALRDHTVLIVIDNTSLTYKMRKRYHQLADTIVPIFGNEFEYNLVFFTPNLKRSLEWNRKRSRQVPEDVIEAQANRFSGPNDKEVEYANIIRID